MTLNSYSNLYGTTNTIIEMMYIYHALINALSTQMVHINLNMILCTRVEHSPTETTHTKHHTERQTSPPPPPHTHTTMNLNVYNTDFSDLYQSYMRALTHTHARTHIRMHARTHTLTHSRTYTHTHTHTHTCA